MLVALLKGSVCFLADLVRELPGPCELDFLVLSAYGDGRTRVRVAKDLDLDVTGRDVVVVMDLVDTGLTLGYVLRLIALRRARSTAACALFDRQSRGCCPSRSATSGTSSATSTSSATAWTSTSATATCRGSRSLTRPNCVPSRMRCSTGSHGGKLLSWSRCT